MGKTKISIRLALQSAQKQADKFEEIARKVEKQRDRLIESEGELCSEWVGDNAGRYQEKMQRREADLDWVITNLYRIAEVVRTVSQNTYNADMEALQVAENRNYGSGGGSRF